MRTDYSLLEIVVPRSEFDILRVDGLETQQASRFQGRPSSVRRKRDVAKWAAFEIFHAGYSSWPTFCPVRSRTNIIRCFSTAYNEIIKLFSLSLRTQIVLFIYLLHLLQIFGWIDNWNKYVITYLEAAENIYLVSCVRLVVLAYQRLHCGKHRQHTKYLDLETFDAQSIAVKKQCFENDRLSIDFFRVVDKQ